MKSVLRKDGTPRFCLCKYRWYKVLFMNKLVVNKYYWIGWIDPESWLEWWYLGVPVRIYYWKREKWIDFPFLSWRDKQIWDHAVAVKIEPRSLPTAKDEDGHGQGKEDPATGNPEGQS